MRYVLFYKYNFIANSESIFKQPTKFLLFMIRYITIYITTNPTKTNASFVLIYYDFFVSNFVVKYAGN